MIRLLFLGLIFCLIVVALVFGALWLNDVPWRIVLERESQSDLEWNMTQAVAILALLSAVLAFVIAIFAGIFRIPGQIGAMRRRSRTRKGNEALASGILAVEGGDLKSAKRLTQKALSDADDERLALLLDARTAEQEEDWTRAERAYAELSRKPGAHLAGLKGLTGAAVKRGDFAMAIKRAREALDVKGETGDWPFKSLFEIYVARGEWSEARHVLSVGETKGHIEAAIARRRRAVLLVAEAHEIMSSDPEQSERLLGDALKLAPGFPPAAFHLARLQMSRESIKSAINTLETAWKARPHPALALIAERIDALNGAGPRKAMTVLVNANKTHRETALLKADLAITEGDWDGAEKALGPLLQGTAPTSRVCRLMEMVSRARNDAVASRDWSEKAAYAPREPEWSDIETDGSAFNYAHEDWARLVYTYGDAEQLIHPRHEGYRAELDVKRNRALPGPESGGGQSSDHSAGNKQPPLLTDISLPPAVPPTDYVKKP